MGDAIQNKTFQPKIGAENKTRLMIQHFEHFIQLFEQEINNNVKKHLVLDAKSEIISLILATVIEFLADGFVVPLESSLGASLQPKFAFWSVISEELQSETLSFAKESAAFANDNDRACVWILLELYNKTISAAFRSISTNQKTMQCYKNEAAFKLLQSSMLTLLARLDALNYSVEAQCIQNFKKHLLINSYGGHKPNLKQEFPGLNSDESEGESKSKPRTNSDLTPLKNGPATNYSNSNVSTGKVYGSPRSLNKSIDANPKAINSEITTSLSKQLQQSEPGSKDLTLERKSPKKTTLEPKKDIDIKAADFVQRAQKMSVRKESQELTFEKKLSVVKVKPSERLYLEKYKIEEELYAYRSEPPDTHNPDVLY